MTATAYSPRTFESWSAKRSTERGVQRAPEREADVLHGVVLIHVEVAFRLEREVEQPVHGDELEHVIEERQARSDIGLAFPVESQGDLDVRLLALSHLPRGARAHEIGRASCR